MRLILGLTRPVCRHRRVFDLVNASRLKSDGPRSHYLEKLLKLTHRKQSPSPSSHTSPEILESVLSLKPHGQLKPITPNDAYISCTVFNGQGNITAVLKRFPKMQFLKENRLFARDFRKIDSSSIDVAPSIMVRPNSILVNLLHIKAIIKKDLVLVFDTSTPEVARKLGLFMYDLELKLKLPSHNVCYEFRALEAILISVMALLEAECKSHVRACGKILTELERLVDRTKLQSLLIKLKALTSYYQKTILIRDVLEELLDNDEDLAGMYLTDPKPLQNPADGNYDELEMILESYYYQYDEFAQRAGSLISDIKVTEEIVNIILDTLRNSLMMFELKLTVYTLGFTVAALLPAFYGMNLKNYIEETSWGFGTIVAIALIQGAVITLYSFRRLKRVQHLTMAGTGLSNGTSPLQSVHKPPIGSNPAPTPAGSLHREKWYYRLLYGSRNTKYVYPSVQDRDAIWRMIHDDKNAK